MIPDPPASRRRAWTFLQFDEAGILLAAILLFAIGVGLAPGVEFALRPVDYPNSETFQRDIRLSVAVVLLLIITMFSQQFAMMLRYFFPA